jgi:hypothetical protein
MPVRILVISDLHVGSVYGLLPPGYHDSRGNEIRQNIGQKYLWDCWLDLAARAKRLRPDVVVVNGDLVDGRRGELCLQSPVDQAEACLQVLQALGCRGAKWFFVQGTEFHDSEAGREVEVVASQLGTSYVGLGAGVYTREVLDLECGGVVVNFAHGISTGAGLYRAVAIDREALWSALAGKAGSLPKADVIVRSHAHYFVHVEHASKHAVVTPCWQLQTRFMRRRSVYRMVPDIGAVVLDVAPGLIGVRKILYPLPTLKPVSLSKL